MYNECVWRDFNLKLKFYIFLVIRLLGGIYKCNNIINLCMFL